VAANRWIEVVPWYGLALCGVIAVILVSAWGSVAAALGRSVRALRHSSEIKDFARTNGWNYTKLDYTLPLHPGQPFAAGVIGACSHVVRGTLQAEAFVAFEYAHADQVVILTLPQPLPYLEVRPQGLAGREALSQPGHKVESEAFNRRFWVRTDDPKFASDVLNPRLMERLLAAPDLCWRIWGEEIVGWWPGELSTGQILLSITLLRGIKASIPDFVWHEAAEEVVRRSASPQSPNV
jgi:hypothetical protein